MDIGERLREIRGKESREAFAQRLGIHAQSLYRYEQGGRSVDSSVIVAICSQCNISSEWLLFGTGPKHPSEQGMPKHKLTHFIQSGEAVDLVMIPRVTARLSAGTGSLDTEADVKGHYAFRSDWICKKGNVSRMVCMDVTGDSMLPEIKHGDMVLIDQSKTDIYGYGIYAMGIDEAVYVKQLRTLPGKLILHSLNPDYDDIILDTTIEQPPSVRVIGRVIWVGRELA